MRKVFITLMALLFIVPVYSNDYTFDLRKLELPSSDNLYEETPIPTGGINVFVRTDGDRIPSLYAWDGATKLLGNFPGTTMTDVKYVSAKGNDDTKTAYYMYHFERSKITTGVLGVIIRDGSSENDQSRDIMLTEDGNYFFHYTGWGGTEFETDKYVSGGESLIAPGETGIFVRPMKDWSNDDNDVQLYLYAWNNSSTDIFGAWPGTKMTKVVYFNNQKWFYSSTTTNLGGIIFSQGDNTTQTGEIKTIKNGQNNFIQYRSVKQGDWDPQYTVLDADQSSSLPLKNRTANFNLWKFNTPSSEIVMTSPDGNFRLTFSLGYENIYVDNKVRKTVANVIFDKENGRLELPAQSTIKVESLSGYNLNEVILGPLTDEIAYGEDRTQFGGEEFPNCPAEENGWHDWFQVSQSKTNAEYYKLSNLFAQTLTNKTELTVGGNDGSEMRLHARYIGPEIYVRDEATTAEELTFADHNIRNFKHLITDDLVGVDVFDGYLIARSVEPISPKHKHMPNGSQQILSVNGSTPAYADPTTVQYSWIALKIDNPAQYKNKQLKNVRGMFCSTGNMGNGHRGWKNPTMEVESFEVNEEAGNVETVLNTYCVANFSEQDKENTHGYTPKYFFMEPRHWEICNVVDVMRSPNETVYAPTENALFPTGGGEKQIYNYYPRYGVEGSANLQDFQQAWAKVDEVTGAAYLTYNHVFRIDHAIALTQDWNQTRDTKYDYPLDTPNSYYDKESENDDCFFLWGMPDTKVTEADGYTDHNFATADLVYFSRYDVENDENEYKNDLRIMINNPKTDMSKIHDLVVTRRDENGDNAVTVATLKREREGQYKVVYNTQSQNTRKDVDGIWEMGDQHYKDTEKVYNLYSTSEEDPNIIYLSDRFVSEALTNEEAVESENDYYQYRVEPGENTPTDVSCVVNGVPVFKSVDFSATRASLTKKQVDDDTTGDLTKDDTKVTIDFTAEAPTTGYNSEHYKVLNGSSRREMGDDLNGDIHMENKLTVDIETADDLHADKLWYVPVQVTDYNNNTYGTYKQAVSDASIEIKQSNIEVSDLTRADGTKYYHVDLSVNTNLQNKDKDARYLVRIWRKMPDGSKKLLNTDNEKDEFTQANDGKGNQVWVTNYREIAKMDKDEATINFPLSDTFAYKPEASEPAGAPALKDASAEKTLLDITYYATLYVQDRESGKYYVKTHNLPVQWTTKTKTAITGIESNAAVASVTYVNPTGMQSAQPWRGINIVVTRYTDGTVKTTKLNR